jgi:hypothetical protein
MGPRAPVATADFARGARIRPSAFPAIAVANVAPRRIPRQIGRGNVATFRIEFDVNNSFTSFHFAFSWLFALSYPNIRTLLRCTSIVESLNL